MFPPLRRRRIREVIQSGDLGENLTSIVQNLIQLESYISNPSITQPITNIDLSTIKTNKLELISFNTRKFCVGQWIDVKDTIHQWLEAEVIDVENRSNNDLSKVKVHYIGWGNNWDEWIPFSSKRIMPFRYYTIEKFRERLCPSTKVMNSSSANNLFSNISGGSAVSVSDLLGLMNKYFNLISDKANEMEKIKQSTSSSTNESQNLYYILLKQLVS